MLTNNYKILHLMLFEHILSCNAQVHKKSAKIGLN